MNGLNQMWASAALASIALSLISPKVALSAGPTVPPSVVATASSAATAAYRAATDRASRPSDPAEKEGLSIVIQATDTNITPDKRIAVHVTYRNATKQPFRFPSGGTGMSSVLFILENVKTGDTYTGGNDRMMNGALQINRPTGRPKPTDPPLAGPIPALQPGETHDAQLASFASMGFYAGKWDNFADYFAARRGLSRGHDGSSQLDGGFGFGTAPGSLKTSPAQIPFLPGTYKLSVNVEFPVGEQSGAPADPIPLWKGLSIRSNSVEIQVFGVAAEYDGFPADAASSDMTPGAGWITGTVLNLQGKPAASVPLFCYPVNDLRNVPKAIPAGQTDESGHYTIKNLPPGRYMVIAGDWRVAGSYPGDPVPQYGSLQPIEVKQDRQAKVGNPIKMTEHRGGGLGGG